jgi:lipid A 4'-phosphatase
MIELGVIVTLFVITFISIRIFNLDLAVSDYFYNKLTADFADNKLLDFLAFLAIIAPIIIFLWYFRAYIKKNVQFKQFRLVVLLLAVGPIGITYGILKPMFDRPRPDDIQRYDSKEKTTFVRALEFGQNTKDKSFPSGHTSIAFTTLLFWFIPALRRKYHWSKTLLPGLLFGFSIGLIRIVQGQHFLSDVVGAFFVIYITDFCIYRWALKSEKNENLSTTLQQ